MDGRRPSLPSRTELHLLAKTASQFTNSGQVRTWGIQSRLTRSIRLALKAEWNGGRYRPGQGGAGSQCGCQMGGGGGERGAGGRPAAAVRPALVGVRLSRALRRLLARA